MSVREPTTDWHSVLRVENVRCRRVVDNDGFSQIAADLGQIFDIVALVVVATLSKKSMMHNVMNIKLVQEWIAVLRIVRTNCAWNVQMD